MNPDARRLALARWLLEAGAGHSARNALGAMRGASANRIRLAAPSARLRPGIYCLVALPEATGAVLPLRPTPGHPRAPDPAFREACVAAYEHVRRVFNDRSLPMLRFEFEEELAVSGPSIGLPAALAFVSHFAPSRAPAGAVLATGGLVPDGRVMLVGHLETKYAVARYEAGAGAIIFPSGFGPRPGIDIVSTFAEAARAAFGDEPLCLDTSLFTVDSLLRSARTLADPAEGLELLESLDQRALTSADRARVLFDLGTLHRNLGHSRAAWELHGEAKALLHSERLVIGGEAAERFELECWTTALDQFRLDATVAELRERLARPFLKLRNELRCRGMLAQGLAMAGRFKEAVAVRSENLAIHERSQSLRKVLPATLCHLALDASLAGDAATFERSVLSLCSVTKAGDESQWRYNAAIIVRGLAALGRFEDARRYSRDEVSVFDCRAPATLVAAARGVAPSVTAPEISALRALVRALRRLGRGEEAISLGARAVEAGRDLLDLFGWMVELVRLELALSQHDKGMYDRAEAAMREAQERLPLLHAGATQFHSRLLHPSTSVVETELERIWY